MDSGYIQEIEEDPSVDLGSLNGGDVFRFANISAQRAIEEDALYMVVSGGKDERTQVSSLKDGLLLVRDNSHKVCHHPDAIMYINVR